MNSAMQMYGDALQVLIWAGWVGLTLVILATIYTVLIELYDAIRQNRMNWSHIQAAFFMAADFVLYKVTRAKNAGRHAAKVKKDDVNISLFWSEIKAEFEAAPYSLSRANRPHKLA